MDDPGLMPDYISRDVLRNMSLGEKDGDGVMLNPFLNCPWVEAENGKQRWLKLILRVPDSNSRPVFLLNVDSQKR